MTQPSTILLDGTCYAVFSPKSVVPSALTSRDGLHGDQLEWDQLEYGLGAILGGGTQAGVVRRTSQASPRIGRRQTGRCAFFPELFDVCSMPRGARRSTRWDAGAPFGRIASQADSRADRRIDFGSLQGNTKGLRTVCRGHDRRTDIPRSVDAAHGRGPRAGVPGAERSNWQRSKKPARSNDSPPARSTRRLPANNRSCRPVW